MHFWHGHSESPPLWVYPKNDPQWRDCIIKEFKIHPVTAQILVSRGFTTLEQIHDYLYAKLPDLHDPYLMAEMPQAVDRVCRALQNKENILIYGDNDVDGMTGTALLTEFLQSMGANVFFYVSYRGTMRQSLIVEALEYAKKNECKLLITVDCGITAAAEIAKVVEQNVDFAELFLHIGNRALDVGDVAHVGNDGENLAARGVFDALCGVVDGALFAPVNGEIGASAR